MKHDELHIGDTIKDSPVGAGAITGITQAGYPQVNEVAVAWLIRTDGVIFNPHNKPLTLITKNWEKVE